MSEKTPNYFELYIYGVKSFEEDLVSSFLFDLGASGVCQKLDFIQTPENFDPRILEKEITDLVVYFEKSIQHEQFLFLKNYCDRFEIKEELQKDWLNEWKKHYNPLEIVPEFWVVPEWIKFDAPKDRQILISPGLAFGTGTHATTQLMAEMINDVLNSVQENENLYDRFLDLGAGTGILSIFMYLKGIKNGVATEIDPMAREKCVENLEINQINTISVEDENFIYKIKSPYSLVVANIIDGVLVNLGESIKNSFSKTLIVSGIIDERKEFFEREFVTKLNLKVLKASRKEIWWGYVLERP